MYELTEERVVPVSAPKAAAAPSYGAFGNRRLLWTAIVIFAVTAWFSEGFIHPDEHFQILEFANYKLGRTPSADLQWEFPAELRPGLQPMLGFGFIRAAEAVGLASPFMQVFVIRLITGFLSLAVFLAWSRALRRLPESRQAGERLPWLVAFLWFVPFLSVRFSSENLAALTFWAGLLLIIRGLFGIDVTRGRAALLSLAGGSLLGLSFYFRFQMGFALVGAAAWIGWQLATRRQGRVPVRNLFLVLVGAAAAAALGTLADYWLYGELVFTPYRYLDTNLLHGKAAEFGASPWWWYFQRIGLREGPPIGLLLLGLAAVGLCSHRRHVMAWVFIPFVCGHLLIAHKELRFLFPMLLPFLVLALFGFDRLAALRSVSRGRAGGGGEFRAVAGSQPPAAGGEGPLLPLPLWVVADSAAGSLLREQQHLSVEFPHLSLLSRRPDSKRRRRRSPGRHGACGFGTRRPVGVAQRRDRRAARLAGASDLRLPPLASGLELAYPRREPVLRLVGAAAGGDCGAITSLS